MCAIHRAGGSAPMNQAHSMDGFADDNGGWGYYEEEEYEEEEEEQHEHHNLRALQQQQRAELFQETGQLPELAVVEQGAPIQQELLDQVPERERPHQPEPTGTAKLAASSQSATYKRTYVRHIDRSRHAPAEPSLQLQPERYAPQPTDPGDLPSILTPPPSNPAHHAPAPVEEAPGAPPPASPWSLEAPEAGVDEHGQPLAQNLPSSPFDVEYGRDPYNALKKLKAPKNPQYAAREPLWPERQPMDPAAAPQPVRPVTPPPPSAPPPEPEPEPQRHKPAVRYLSTRPTPASGPQQQQHAPAPPIDDLDETIGGANSFLLVDDDFFDKMAGQAPPPAPPSRPRSHAPKIALDEALGAVDLEAIIANEEIMDIGLVSQEVDGDTMFAGDAEALLKEAAAELASGGWADEDPFQAALLSLEQMPLHEENHPGLQEDHLDSTMTGSIEDFPGLSFEDDDWKK